MAIEKAHISIVLVVATLAVVGTSVLALLSVNQKISNNGNIKTVGVGVYKDSACSQKLTTINWETLTPGQARNYTAYVRNEGTTALVLSKTVGNWSPSTASNYITLGWNREGSVLNAGANVQATLTLSVSASITGVPTFSFDITITGTEQ